MAAAVLLTGSSINCQIIIILIILIQVSGLKRQLLMGRDAAFEEVQLRNRFLADKVQQLEQGMSKRTSSAPVPVCRYYH